MDDLKDVREEISRIIIQTENLPIMAENFMETGSPKEVIETKIDECDCFIGILHKKWGLVPLEGNPQRLSVTAIEYERAKEKGKPTLVFISTTEKEKELQDFIEKISNYTSGRYHIRYNDTKELIRQIALGIHVLIREVQTKSSSKLNDSYSMKYASDQAKKKYIIKLIIETDYSYFRKKYENFRIGLRNYLNTKSNNDLQFLDNYRNTTFKPFISTFIENVVLKFDRISNMISNPVLWYNFRHVIVFHGNELKGMLDVELLRASLQDAFWNEYINDLEFHYNWIKDYIEFLELEARQ